MRNWVYRAVKHFANEERWLQAFEYKATEINTGFADPLPYKEVQHTAKACGRWSWRNGHKFGSRPKVLKFTTETAQERMSKGAEYTNAIRAEKAIQTLQKER